MQTRLMRSATERMIAGVCGGLAEYFVIDPALVRLIFVLVFFTSGLSLPIYLVLWLIMPARAADAGSVAVRSAIPPMAAYRYDPQTGQPIAPEAPATGATVQLSEPATTTPAAATADEPAPQRQSLARIIGISLLVAGGILLLGQLGVAPRYVFAGLLIAAGVLFLRRR